MKAISLWNPWATLVAIGAKKWETRSWQTNYRGPVAILAAKKWNAELRVISRQHPFWDYTRPFLIHEGKMDAGGVVAIVDLTEIITTGEWMRRHCRRVAPPEHHFPHPTFRESKDEYAFGDYSPGRYAWKLENLHPVTPMIPMRGRQGLWTLTAEETAALAPQPEVACGHSHTRKSRRDGEICQTCGAQLAPKPEGDK